MDPNKLPDYLSLIKQQLDVNRQIDALKVLFEYHLKTESMLQMLLDSNIANGKNDRLKDYVSAVKDFVIKAKSANLKVIADLMQLMR